MNYLTTARDTGDLGYSNPVVVCFASKLASLTSLRASDAPDSVLAVKDLIEYAKNVVTSIKGKASEDQTQDNLWQELVRQLANQTMCQVPKILGVAFERLFDAANWNGREDDRNKVAADYVSSRRYVTSVPGECSEYPLADWKYLVENDETSLDYRKWVLNQYNMEVAELQPA